MQLAEHVLEELGICFDFTINDNFLIVFEYLVAFDESLNQFCGSQLLLILQRAKQDAPSIAFPASLDLQSCSIQLLQGLSDSTIVFALPEKPLNCYSS